MICGWKTAWMAVAAVIVSDLGLLIAANDLNVYFITDKNSKVATDSVQSAVSYVKSKSDLGITNVKIEELELMESEEPSAAVESVCRGLDNMLDGGYPPDVVLDFTKGGMSSEVVKSLSLALGLPTVAATYGEKGDISNHFSNCEPKIDLLTYVTEGRNFADKWNLFRQKI